jgi:hypothetical protein
VPFFDATKLFEENDETLYYDACHVIPTGSRKLGRYCAARALEVMQAERPATSPQTVDH